MNVQEKQLRDELRALERAEIDGEQREQIRRFVDHLFACGLSKGRIAQHIHYLVAMARRCNLGNAKREEIEKIVAWINSRDWSPRTKIEAKGILKRFIKWLKYGRTDEDVPYPPEVAWIKLSLKKHQERKPEILTEGEIEKMIEAALNPRDRAFIAVLAEGGFRIGEMLGIRLKDIRFDEFGARVKVRGKTGERYVRLITSVSLLANWIAVHPFKNLPHAALWVEMKGKKPLSYFAAKRMLKLVAERAGITKRVHPHLFRHTAATRDSRFLTESELKVKYGWDMASKMPAVYVHLAGRDIDEKLIAIYSGKQIEPPKPEFRPIICPRCKEKNTPGQRYCGRCGTPLNPEELTKARIEDEQIRREIHELKALIRSLL